MNPLFQKAILDTVRRRLMRVCPACKREQRVALSRQREVVACKFCRAKIPPPPK